MDGILAIWKPEGWTSHDVVAKVRRLLGMKRVGHTGTLDPMVTGVLPLCLGRATRVVEYVQERPKSYTAVLKLGVATDTEDLTGTIIEQQSSISVTEADVLDALQSFIGQIEQVPPMFSAVKIDGKRLYELAREGKVVERNSRTVTIHQIELLETKLELDQPEITFSVLCSKGTYIRTLCVDLGKKLGVPAAMAKLTRTMSGGISEKSCLTLEQVAELQQAGALEQHLIAADEAITHIAKFTIDADSAKKALLGQKLRLTQAFDEEHPMAYSNELIRLYGPNEAFLGIFEIDAEAKLLKPVKVFS